MIPMLSEFLPVTPPYALIGKAVVEAFLVCVILISLAVALILWYRGWKRISRVFWYGEENPPVWRVRLAAVASTFAVLKLHKLPAVLAEAPTLTNNHTTFRQTLSRKLRKD